MGCSFYSDGGERLGVAKMKYNAFEFYVDVFFSFLCSVGFRRVDDHQVEKNAGRAARAWNRAVDVK